MSEHTRPPDQCRNDYEIFATGGQSLLTSVLFIYKSLYYRGIWQNDIIQKLKKKITSYVQYVSRGADAIGGIINGWVYYAGDNNHLPEGAMSI